MQATILYGPRDVRVEERPDPTILEPTDAVIRIAAACVCGSDLWPYRGVQTFAQPTPMGHEYCGIVEEVGRDVRTIRPGPVRRRVVRHVGQHVRALPHGYHSSCVHREFLSGCAGAVLSRTAGGRHAGRHT